MIAGELRRSEQVKRHATGASQHSLGRLLALVCLGLFASAVFAVHPYDRWAKELGIDPNVSYDGTRVMEFQGGSFEMTERRAPGKMYTEMYVGNMTTGVILREDLAKSYILMPSMGFYREESLDDGMMQASNGLEFSKIEKVGTEDVNGYASTKYKARFKDKEGRGAGFIWVTNKGVPIKMDMIYSNKEAKGQRLTMQFTELNMRAQDPKYFELPKDLQPMTMGAGFANLGKMMGMGTAAPDGDAGNQAPATSAGSSDDTAGTIGSVTSSVSEGAKGLAKSMGLGSLFGMKKNKAEAPVKTASSSAQDSLTQTVQKHLKTLGYDPGNTKGEESVQTSIAISQFQAEKGMKVTGEVSPQLAGILEAEVEK